MSPRGVVSALVCIAAMVALLLGLRVHQRHAGATSYWQRGVAASGGGPRYRYEYGDPTKLGRGLDAYAEARCVREARCHRVGEGHRYASEANCTERVRAHIANHWHGASCEDGLDERELDECVHTLVSADCDLSDEEIAALSACRAVEVCDRR